MTQFIYDTYRHVTTNPHPNPDLPHTAVLDESPEWLLDAGLSRRRVQGWSCKQTQPLGTLIRKDTFPRTARGAGSSHWQVVKPLYRTSTQAWVGGGAGRMLGGSAPTIRAPPWRRRSPGKAN